MTQDIPEDIMRVARERAETWRGVDNYEYEGNFIEDLAQDFAEVMLAERELAAKIARNYPTDRPQDADGLADEIMQGRCE